MKELTAIGLFALTMWLVHLQTVATWVIALLLILYGGWNYISGWIDKSQNLSD